MREDYVAIDTQPATAQQDVKTKIHSLSFVILSSKDIIASSWPFFFFFAYAFATAAVVVNNSKVNKAQTVSSTIDRPRAPPSPPL